jgi:DNA-binding SARP family transcriptional activator/basic membrane lipoprotein Med (substrate-binding protein (PBP1-ABC) superfamily)
MPSRACFATDATNKKKAIEFRILGPLEIRLGDEAVPPGGAKQRTVLSVLLLWADEVVPVERLVDEVWGDDPPPSALHSLEAYVSRLRRLLPPGGPELVRRGAGYSLPLGEALVDARAFGDMLAAADRAAAQLDHRRAAELAREALALWRGDFLADVALGPAGRAEAQRLEELRLRALELCFDAELVAGRHEDVIGELRLLVAQHPYRERFVAQLMLALYRAGRHADALAVYEDTRAAMAELGLQPSAELQRLSGQVVRQETALDRRAPSSPVVEVAASPSKRARAPSGLALVGAIAVAVMAFIPGGSGRQSAIAAGPKPKDVALVLPSAPTGTAPQDLMALWRDSVAKETRRHGLTLQTIVAGDVGRKGAARDRMVTILRSHGFGLVLWIGDGRAARAIAPDLRLLSRTRFVFVDASLETLHLEGVPNASAVRFADEEASELVGYMSGLVRPRGLRAPAHADVVSIVGGAVTPQARQVIARFERGVRRALPRVRVLVDYVGETTDKTPCERAANSQIDRGADVVFATAGTCGVGALAVAGTRGVWGVGDDALDRDSSGLRERMLVHTYRAHTWAIERSVRSFVHGSLPDGKDLVLGLDDDYAVGVWDINSDVPQAIRSKVVELCTAIRERSRQAES